MEHPSCPPVHPVRAGDVDDYNAFAWRERHPVEDRVSGQRLAEEPTFAEILSSLPDWAVISAGGLVAAILGAMVGGALHI